MKKPMTIGTESFETKDLARQRCREVLDKYLGSEIPPGKDWDLVMALLKLHPYAANKIGGGVATFRVVLEGQSTGKDLSRHFQVIRSDGTEIDFSHKQCLNGGSKRADCLEAMRAAVADQLAAARSAVVGVVAGCQAHHEGASFQQLADQWMQQEKLTFESVAVTRPEDGIGKVMGDPEQMSSWQEFHLAQATLAPMDAETHRHLPKGPRQGQGAEERVV